MAKRIRREDVDLVRERSRIEEIVGEHVTLRGSGSGSLKGLCPFHDERTPSFHVRPHLGLWHCFGCGEGGDIFSFISKIDGLSFAEAVELLASRYGVELHYEGSEQPGPDVGSRRRLLAVNQAALEFFRSQVDTPAAAEGRKFLTERGFDSEAARCFEIGFAPAGWDALTTVLRRLGFTDAELLAAGVVSQGQRGVYDRFRGRLVWPIKDAASQVLGFGARKLFADDPGPKYLNTPETMLYKKSTVLYGLDRARSEIVKRKQVVVVEGYTDVMAAHLSGVTTAVATCGTAFGPEHTRLVRRMLGDTQAMSGLQVAAPTGEVVFTFDGDEAGKKAALRAYGEDQSFLARTFVAIEPSGLDPCDVRLLKGPTAVQRLVASRVPLFAFVIQVTLAAYDLETAEGRVAALRAAAPVVVGIKDPVLRGEYARLLSGWTGIDPKQVELTLRGARAGRSESRRSESGRSERGGEGKEAVPGQVREVVGARLLASSDPAVRLERQALSAIVQAPTAVPLPLRQLLEPDTFTISAFRAVYEAVMAVGWPVTLTGAGWIAALRDAAPGELADFVTQLAVMPQAYDRDEDRDEYVAGVVAAAVDRHLVRQIGKARGVMQRLASGTAEHEACFATLVSLEAQRRTLHPAT